jgi:hypothetical protein
MGQLLLLLSSSAFFFFFLLLSSSSSFSIIRFKTTERHEDEKRMTDQQFTFHSIVTLLEELDFRKLNKASIDVYYYFFNFFSITIKKASFPALSALRVLSLCCPGSQLATRQAHQPPKGKDCFA